jgi:hypothetical protein
MTTVSSMALNDRACFLLSQGYVSEGLELFKKALSVLKNEIRDQSTGSLNSVAQQKPQYQEREAAAVTNDAGLFGWLTPAPKACTKEHGRFWIFSHPLSMQRVKHGSACAMWSNHADVFTISFNVALASHLQGCEQEVKGDHDAACHSFIVAIKMYNLTLYQCQAEDKINMAMVNTLNGHVYAAIFNNLAHIHAMLGKRRQSTAYAEQLLKTLVYLVDSGRVTTFREATTHKLLLENAQCLLMTSSISAAAA